MPNKSIQLVGSMGPMDLIQADNLTDSTFKGLTSQYPIYVNGYFESMPANSEGDRKAAFVKRFGVKTVIADPGTGYNGYTIQGVISSLDRTKILFYMNNGTVNRTGYYDGTTLTISAGNAPAAAGNWSFTLPVVWTALDGISYGANNYYAVTDFGKGAVVNATGTWTEITDVDFTGLAKITNFVGMDGYLFIGTTNNRIYNSDLNVATSWAATSFLSVSDVPGALLWLGRIKNYIVAFKQFSLEFYENTGNPTPGSPLTVQKSLRKSVGLVTSASVQYVSDGIIFLGISEKLRTAVYKLYYDDLRLEVISDTFVENTIAMVNSYGNPGFINYSVDFYAYPSFGTLPSGQAQSQTCTWAGKEFYFITLKGPTITDTGRTLVYDNQLKVWVLWNTWIQSTAASSLTQGIFDPSQCIQFNQSGITYQVFVINNPLAYESATPRPVFIAAQGAYGGTCNDSTVNGTSKTFPWVYVSDIFDFGNRNRKFMDALEYLFESDTAGSSMNLTLYYRNAGYATTTGQAVTRSLLTTVDGNANRARFTRLGPFRARQVGFKEESTKRYKLLAIHAQINEGEQDQDG